MEQIITAKHLPTGLEHTFTFGQWITKKEELQDSGEKLYKFISVNKQVSTSNGSQTNPPPPPPKKKKGCGCGG